MNEDKFIGVIGDFTTPESVWNIFEISPEGRRLVTTFTTREEAEAYREWRNRLSKIIA